ncbi:MAG: hypothetical protein ACFFA0_13085 [Promethearchaeota archaeon]
MVKWLSNYSKNLKNSVPLWIIMVNAILTVNEKQIPLKEFMQDMLTNIILGYLKSTKAVPENIETIKIEIKL